MWTRGAVQQPTCLARPVTFWKPAASRHLASPDDVHPPLHKGGINLRLGSKAIRSQCMLCMACTANGYRPRQNGSCMHRMARHQLPFLV